MTARTRRREWRTHSDNVRLFATVPMHKAYERMLREERVLLGRGHRADRRPVTGRRARHEGSATDAR